jgi:(+)-trans-carveol dehydrogenase
MGRLDGKVAFITGAARGQGRSHALKLAEEGSDIIALDISHQIDLVEFPMATPEDLALTRTKVEALGRRILTRAADVRDQQQVDAVIAEGTEKIGPVDIVVANAGISVMKSTWEHSEEEWINVVDVNMNGIWRTVKSVIPAMIDRRKGGSIILTSSVAGVRGMPYLSAYVTSKHGVVGLMSALANELAEYSIRVNAVLPGTVATPMALNEHMYRTFRPDLDNPTSEDVLDSYRQWHALPVALIDPVDVSNAVAFLASEESRYITGAALPVDAGMANKF